MKKQKQSIANQNKAKQTKFMLKLKTGHYKPRKAKQILFCQTRIKIRQIKQNLS